MQTLKSFQRKGYAVQSGVYSEEELPRIREVLAANPSTIRGVWTKDLCASSRNFLNLATHPKIMGPVREILGDDVILWGGIYIQRVPGQVHQWHTDIESSRAEGGFLSVWIGLEGVTRRSSLKLLDHSHTFGKPLQQVMQEQGHTRETTTDDDVSQWSAQLHPGHLGISQPDVVNGDAIIFDGRLWHGSDNRNPEQTRTALLFQFARADVAVRIPNLKSFDWPFELHDAPLPPCIVVSGKGDPAINKLVEPPPVIDASLEAIGTRTDEMDQNALPEEGRPFRSIPLYAGKTPNLAKLGVHYSVLSAGGQPHPPHAHVDEEILIVLKGTASLRYEEDGEVVDHPATAGEGVYYPSFHRHTIHNPGPDPIVYLMFKWVGAGQQGKPLGLQRMEVPALEGHLEEGKGFQARPCFRGPTQHLKTLQVHVSTLLPDGGYDAHVDEHDVAIVVFEGSIRINGNVIGPSCLHYISAGESHDMSNPTQQPARYLVIEFHGGNCPGDYLSISKPKAHRFRRRLFKKRSPKRILRNLKRMLGLGD